MQVIEAVKKKKKTLTHAAVDYKIRIMNFDIHVEQ